MKRVPVCLSLGILLLACSSGSNGGHHGHGGHGGATGGSGGSTGGSGGGGSGGGGSGGGGSGGGGSGGSPVDTGPETPAIQLPPPPATCEQQPVAVHPNAPVYTFVVKPTVGGQAVDLGVPMGTGSSRVTLSQLRFFVTQPVFVRADGTTVAADLVDAAGKTLPYGLTLVDLDKPDSLTVRLRAPAGDYDRLSLSIGVHRACNSGPQPAALVYPLNAGGGMTWTWTLGYIFVFLEGNKGDGPPAPLAAHGGMMPPSAGAVALSASGSFGAPAAPRTLEARLDQLIEVVDGQNHLVNGAELMQRLPTADFWRVSTP